MKYAGYFLVIISVVLFFIFKFYIVKLAYTKLPDGNYGELFGPISYFKNYIYFILVILFISGVICVFKSFYNSVIKKDRLIHKFD
jgi:hypothetical protein